MKNFLAVVMLLFAASAANATTVQYWLDRVTYQNTFASERPIAPEDYPDTKLLGECWSCLNETYGGTGDPATASTAYVNDQGNVTAFGAGWSGGPTQGQEYHVLWDLATLLGDGVILAKTSDNCIAISGSFCDDAANGLGGSVLYSGFAPDGMTEDGRLAVNVSQPDSETLVIAIQRALSATSGFTQTYRLYYSTVVPVPAAAWMFGSALGLLGWINRRTT